MKLNAGSAIDIYAGLNVAIGHQLWEEVVAAITPSRGEIVIDQPPELYNAIESEEFHDFHSQWEGATIDIVPQGQKSLHECRWLIGRFLGGYQNKKKYFSRCE